jgi:hypothetical protein
VDGDVLDILTGATFHVSRSVIVRMVGRSRRDISLRSFGVRDRGPDVIVESCQLHISLRGRGRVIAKATRITKIFVDFYETFRINSRRPEIKEAKTRGETRASPTD